MTKVSKAAIWIALCFVIARVSVTRAQRGAVASGTKYSPLDQINAVNVKQLQIVWRWKPDGFGPRPDSSWQVTPLLNDGSSSSSRLALAAPRSAWPLVFRSKIDNCKL